MLKKILFFSLFTLFLHAEPLVLVDVKGPKLFFKDGSVYRLTKESQGRFSEKSLGATFDVVRLPKTDRKRSFDTQIKNSAGTFQAQRIAEKTEWRQINMMKKSGVVKNEKPINHSRLIVISQNDRLIKLSDGSVFEAQTLLPERKIEGEEVSIEEVEFHQIKTKPGEKILMKQIKKSKS
jgi:hypothetical protein